MNAPAIISVSIPSLQMAEDELIKVLESSIYPGAKLESIKLVIGYCKGNQLDPMTKPVHIVPMSVKKAGTRDQYEWRDVIMPGIELYRTKAARTGEYVGIEESQMGPDVTADNDVGLAYPAWCSITVYRLVGGERCSFSSGKVFWKETYATDGKDSTKPNRMWKKRPYGQLEKCAEAMALRRAFPEIGSEPTREEMEGKVIEHDVTAAVPQIEQPKAAGTESASAGSDALAATTPVEQHPEGEKKPEADTRPMAQGQKNILRAKLKNTGLTDVDVEAKFTRKLDAEGWLFTDFDQVQNWIKSRGTK